MGGRQESNFYNDEEFEGSFGGGAGGGRGGADGGGRGGYEDFNRPQGGGKHLAIFFGKRVVR